MLYSQAIRIVFHWYQERRLSLGAFQIAAAIMLRLVRAQKFWCLLHRDIKWEIRLEEIPKNVRYNIAPSQGSHHEPHLEKNLASWGSQIWLNSKQVCTINVTAYFWTCKPGRHHKRDACLVPRDETCQWYMKQRAEVAHVLHFRAHPRWFSTIPMMLTLHPYSVRRAMRPSLSYVFAVELRSHDVQFHGLCP